MNKIKEYPLAIFCGLVILVCVVMHFMRGGVIDSLHSQESDLNGQLRLIEKNKLHSQGLEQGLEHLNVTLEPLEERLFRRDQSALNTRFFYAYEDALDVTVTSVSQLPSLDTLTSKGGPYELKQHSVIMFEVNVEAAYSEILHFLNKMYTDNPFIRVAGLQISGSKRASTEQITSARFRVHVLAHKE
ncbi:MAG: hypothetical protein ACSHX8_00485 [Opitutaceae bacterium]